MHHELVRLFNAHWWAAALVQRHGLRLAPLRDHYERTHEPKLRELQSRARELHELHSAALSAASEDDRYSFAAERDRHRLALETHEKVCTVYRERIRDLEQNAPGAGYTLTDEDRAWISARVDDALERLATESAAGARVLEQPEDEHEAALREEDAQGVHAREREEHIRRNREHVRAKLDEQRTLARKAIDDHDAVRSLPRERAHAAAHAYVQDEIRSGSYVAADGKTAAQQ